MSVVVVPYDPIWPQHFAELSEKIWPSIKGSVLRIEHVGSTSVPGLAAKPVIDMDIVVSDLTASDLVIQALEKLGYQHRGNLGLEGREAMKAPVNLPSHHLYVCLEDGEPYQNHILVKNYLLTHSEKVKEYGDLKLALAKEFPEDIDGYMDGKTDLLLQILKESGFSSDALKRAEVINRRTVQKGKIIFLNGASSSGKSTLAKALQECLPEPFWHYSIDHLGAAKVLPRARIDAGDFSWKEMREAFFEGFHRSLPAFAVAGNNLIVEHIIETQEWMDRLSLLFYRFDVFTVGVHCPLPELERRELERGDRRIGEAKQDFETTHKFCKYDIEVLSTNSPEENAKLVISTWLARSVPTTFSPLL